MKSQSSQRGYSLAEALVAVAIVGLVTMVSVPAFMTMYRSGQVKISARQFAADARWARQLAVTSRKPVKITFSTGTSATSYNIYEQVGGVWSSTASRTGALQKNTYVASTTFDDIGGGADATVPDDGDSLGDIVFKSNGSLWKIESANTVAITSAHTGLARRTFTITFRATGSLVIN